MISSNLSLCCSWIQRDMEKNTNNCCTVQLEDADGGQGVAQWTNPFSIKGRSRYSWIKSTSWHLGHKGNRTKNTSNKRISERGFPAIKTSFASKHIAYLKAKDIKHSNRHLHLAFEYDVIHFADQPTKQLCIYFLCKCIPVKIITHSINFNPRARTVVSESENHNSGTRTKVIIRVK